MKKLNLFGLLPVLLIVAAVTKRFWNWDFDDGFIVYRYVENILSSHSWVYNIGENYNASTSPLNTILTTLFAVFTQDVFTAAHTLGGLSLAVMGSSLFFLLRRSAPTWFASLFTALIVFLMGNNFTWGLETNLFYALLSLFICLDVYGRTSWALLGVLVLARPDALILVALCGARELFLRKRFPLKGIFTFTAVILPWAAFSLYNFGNVFPATLKQKIWQGSSGYWGTGYIFFDGLLAYIKGTTFYHLSGVYWAPVILVIPLVLAPQGIIELVREKSISVLMLATYIFSVLVAYTMLNVPNYHWYYVGLIILSYILAAYGIVYVIKNFKFIYSDLLNYGLIALAVLGSAGLVYKTKADFKDLRTDVYLKLSEKINSSVDSQAKVAAVEVGVFAYYTRRRIVDIVGLTTPYGEFITGNNNDKFFDELKPEVIIMHNPLMLHEQAVFSDPRFTARYQQRDFVTAEGYSELVYYVLSPERPFKGADTLNFINSSGVEKTPAGFKVVDNDPWLELTLQNEKDFSQPLLQIEYDLQGPGLKEGQAVMGRVYVSATGGAFTEASAFPMLLRAGANRKALINLYLPGSQKDKLQKIHRVRIDPIQDFKFMADSNIAIRNASVTSY